MFTDVVLSTVGDLSTIVKGASQKKKEREEREYSNGA
jgi:hypothetical protein